MEIQDPNEFFQVVKRDFPTGIIFLYEQKIIKLQNLIMLQCIFY